jgi:hypothetical protein
MNKVEALALLETHLGTWKTRTHGDLVALIGKQSCSELRGSSGAVYQVEVEAFWDAARGGNIRVIGSIDDGGLRALVPLSSDFILTPASRLVGEPS